VKFWIDACLSPTLEEVAYERGYEATSNRRRNMLSELDPNLYPTVVEQADAEDEPPSDWMVMRVVTYHEDDTITHEWLPQQD
jgi:hypothetical protein